MSFALSRQSMERLAGVHPDLIRVVRGAILLSKIDFTVVEGLRTLERQKQLFRECRTRTMKSRHLTGHAVDLAPLLDTDGDGKSEVHWERQHFYPIVDAMRESAATEKVLIEWGGDWHTFIDMPHWQLPWSKYP
jgi:peptidoglycan L-alanyl-D-glutamate endopeptidase CwlK